MRVLSVNAGLPREVTWRGKPVTTGIYKEPADGRVPVRRLNLDGDRQADLRVHGGPDKAVYAYPSEFYELWSRERPELAIATPELAAALAANDVLLVDARAAARFRGEVEPIDTRAGHVPGAVSHPFQENLGADGRFLAERELRARYQALLCGREAAELVSMCGSGVTACHNLLALEHAGLHGARLYVGSWSEWIRDPRRPIATAAK